MTLEKAIRILAFWESCFQNHHDQQLKEALQVVLKALKETAGSAE